MCVNSQGELYQLTNHVWNGVSAPAKLTQISISSNKQAVALDAAGNVYYKNFMTPSWIWSIIPNAKLTYISISNS
jgi:hypothetical protein